VACTFLEQRRGPLKSSEPPLSPNTITLLRSAARIACFSCPVPRLHPHLLLRLSRLSPDLSHFSLLNEFWRRALCCRQRESSLFGRAALSAPLVPKTTRPLPFYFQRGYFPDFLSPPLREDSQFSLHQASPPFWKSCPSTPSVSFQERLCN